MTSFDAGLAEAARISPTVPSISVTQTTAGTALFPKTLGQFDEGAWTELLLFLFLIALTGGVALIETAGSACHAACSPPRPLPAR